MTIQNPPQQRSTKYIFTTFQGFHPWTIVHDALKTRNLYVGHARWKNMFLNLTRQKNISILIPDLSFGVTNESPYMPQPTTYGILSISSQGTFWKVQVGERVGFRFETCDTSPHALQPPNIGLALVLVSSTHRWGSVDRRQLLMASAGTDVGKLGGAICARRGRMRAACPARAVGRADLSLAETGCSLVLPRSWGLRKNGLGFTSMAFVSWFVPFLGRGL